MNKITLWFYKMGFGLLGLWLRFIEGADLVADNKRLRSELRRSLEINKDLIQDWYKVKQQNEALSSAIDSIRKRWIE